MINIYKLYEKKKYCWWKKILSDRFMKMKKQVNIYERCFFETMTLWQIQHFNLSQMKVVQYAHALFNDMKLIIESTIIDKITIVLKFVMLFYLKIIDAINRINYFRVLIYTLNNATINNLIKRFHKSLQTQKKTLFVVVIKLHNIFTKRKIFNAISKQSFFKSMFSSNLIFELNDNDNMKIKLSILHVTTTIQEIFEKLYVCQHKMIDKRYTLSHLNLTIWMFRVVKFVNNLSKMTNVFQHKTFWNYFQQRQNEFYMKNNMNVKILNKKKRELVWL